MQSVRGCLGSQAGTAHQEKPAAHHTDEGPGRNSHGSHGSVHACFLPRPRRQERNTPPSQPLRVRSEEVWLQGTDRAVAGGDLDPRPRTPVLLLYPGQEHLSGATAHLQHSWEPSKPLLPAGSLQKQPWLSKQVDMESLVQSRDVCGAQGPSDLSPNPHRLSPACNWQRPACPPTGLCAEGSTG